MGSAASFEPRVGQAAKPPPCSLGEGGTVLSCVQLFVDPMDCSPLGSSVHGDSPDQNTGVGSLSLLQGLFLSQGSSPGPPHCRILYHLSHQGSPTKLEWVAYASSRGSSQSRNGTGASCIAGGFFTSCARGQESLHPASGRRTRQGQVRTLDACSGLSARSCRDRRQTELVPLLGKVR